MIQFLFLILGLSGSISAESTLPEMTIEICDCGGQKYMTHELMMTPNPAILFDPLLLWMSYQLHFTEKLKNKLESSGYTWNDFYDKETVNFTISVPELCTKYGFKCTYENIYKCAQGMHDEELCKILWSKITTASKFSGFAPMNFYKLMNSGNFQPFWKIILGILQQNPVHGRLYVSFPSIPNAFCADINIIVKKSNYNNRNYVEKNAQNCVKPEPTACAVDRKEPVCLNGGRALSDGTCDCPYPFSGLMCQFPCLHTLQNLTQECKPSQHPSPCGCSLYWYATHCIQRIKDTIEIGAEAINNNTGVRLNWTLPVGFFFANTFAHYEFRISDTNKQIAARVRDQVMLLEGRENVYLMVEKCNTEGQPHDNPMNCGPFTLKPYHQYKAELTLLFSQVNDDAMVRPTMFLGSQQFDTAVGLPLPPTGVAVANKTLEEPNLVVLVWSIEKDNCAGEVLEYEVVCQLENDTSLSKRYADNEDCSDGSDFKQQIPQYWMFDGKKYWFKVRVRTSINWGDYSSSVPFTFNKYVPSDKTSLSTGAYVAIIVSSTLVVALAVGLIAGYIYLRRVQKWNGVYAQLLRLKQGFRSRSVRGSPPHFVPPLNPEEKLNQGTPGGSTIFEPSPQVRSVFSTGQATPADFSSIPGPIMSDDEDDYSYSDMEPSAYSSGYQTPAFNRPGQINSEFWS